MRAVDLARFINRLRSVWLVIIKRPCIFSLFILWAGWMVPIRFSGPLSIAVYIHIDMAQGYHALVLQRFLPFIQKSARTAMNRLPSY